jgi:hypothetical protein
MGGRGGESGVHGETSPRRRSGLGKGVALIEARQFRQTLAESTPVQIVAPLRTTHLRESVVARPRIELGTP